MILINRITNFAIENYQSDIINCLNHNISVSFIEKIIVFSNNPKIILPNNNRIQLIIKNNYSDSDIIEYVKRVYKTNVFIFSNPFIKFNHTLLNINLNGDQYSKIDSDCFLFTNQSKTVKSDVINDIFNSTHINFNVSLERKHNWTEDIKSDRVIISKQSFREKSKSEIAQNTLITNGKAVYNPISKIDIVVVSVDYNDLLVISLENNLEIIKNITVVTSSEDTVCQEICKKFGVRCIITDRMYDDDAPFNKGKAINDGIKSLVNPEWILLIDADICLPKDFYQSLEEVEKDPKSLFTCERYFCKDYESYKLWKQDNNKFNGRKERSKWLGYFQLFNINSVNQEYVYPEEFGDASWSDIAFRNKFTKKTELNTRVAHLGDAYVNWKGRKTERFISEEEFNNITNINNFDINSYFDKIYCLNLDRRPDRWNKVSNEFFRLGINVERWSAIDGDNLTDSELKFVDDNLDESKASRIGKIENKYALACLLSHVDIIKNAKARGYKKILIFEDDVILSKDFSEKVKLIGEIDWKIFYLGASQFIWDNIEIQNGYYNCNKTLGTFAYAIDSSIFDELINLFERRQKSVDNYLSTVQTKYKNQCFTIYPNIVISDVEDSDIRNISNIEEYSQNMRWNLKLFENKIRVLLVPDVKDWAFDNIAKSIVKYNSNKEKIDYDIIYIGDIHRGFKIEYEKYDYVYVFFEAERAIPDSIKVIRGCYSAFWLENPNFSPEIIGNYMSNSGGAIFANNFLKNSISKYLPENYSTTIIHDSSDENLFYPIENQKQEKFTVIFVGNTKRKVKNFEEIKFICQQAEVKLIVCTDVKNSELVNYYNKADLCINFSDFEGGPQTFIESSLCEVPMLIRSNNELSKLIPCFTGVSKEDFISILNNLKENRHKCKEIGKEARKVCLENFTYKKTAEKFNNFFLNLNSEKYKSKVDDLSNILTVFVISCGENPNYQDCLNSLYNQTIKFKIKEVRNVSPMSKAFQKMIDDCDTDYYIQVDEDMILFENSIEIIYNSLLSSENNICTVAHMLKDVHLDFNLYGIKGYKHKILRNYPYNLEIISCEVDQVKRLQNDGYQTLMNSKVLGYHSPKWTDEIIFERYFDLMEKWKNFKYDWLGELPSKLLKIFRNEPSDLNFYALMGAMTSISSNEKMRSREKNFLIKDENFNRIKKASEIKEFRFIKNYDVEESNILTKNNFGENKNNNNQI